MAEECYKNKEVLIVPMSTYNHVKHIKLFLNFLSRNKIIEIEILRREDIIKSKVQLREKILFLAIKGCTQIEIAKILNFSRITINKEFKYIKFLDYDFIKIVKLAMETLDLKFREFNFPIYLELSEQSRNYKFIKKYSKNNKLIKISTGALGKLNLIIIKSPFC